MLYCDSICESEIRKARCLSLLAIEQHLTNTGFVSVVKTANSCRQLSRRLQLCLRLLFLFLSDNSTWNWPLWRRTASQLGLSLSTTTPTTAAAVAMWNAGHFRQEGWLKGKFCWLNGGSSIQRQCSACTKNTTGAVKEDKWETERGSTNIPTRAALHPG